MRTKDDILVSYYEYKKPGRNSTDLRTFTELARLEVLIDIRDVFVDTRKVLCGIYDYLVMDK